MRRKWPLVACLLLACVDGEPMAPSIDPDETPAVTSDGTLTSSPSLLAASDNGPIRMSLITHGTPIYQEIGLGVSIISGYEWDAGRQVYGDIPDLATLGIDNAVKAVVVYPGGPAALYSGPNYTGRCVMVWAGEMQGVPREVDGSVSSVKLDATCSGPSSGNGPYVEDIYLKNTGSSSSSSCPNNYQQRGSDLNQGTDGDHIWMCVRYGTDPDDAISENVEIVAGIGAGPSCSDPLNSSSDPVDVDKGYGTIFTYICAGRSDGPLDALGDITAIPAPMFTALERLQASCEADFSSGSATLVGNVNSGVTEATMIMLCTSSGHASEDLALVGDAQPPVIAGAAKYSLGGVDIPLADSAWLRVAAGVQVTWPCTDDVLVSSVTPSQSFAAADRDVELTGTCSDGWGNTSQATFRLRQDLTAPTITTTITAGEAEYTPGTTSYRPVTVAWTCADATSGIEPAGTSDSTTITGGLDQQVTIQCVDRAGNVTETAVTDIDVVAVTALPSIRYRLVNGQGQPVSPNAAEWFRETVTIDFVCTQPEGGAPITSCSPDQVITDARSGNLWQGSVTDAAGNFAWVHTPIIHVDTHAPTVAVSLTGTSGQTGFYRSDVHVDVQCDDIGSGLAACPAGGTYAAEGAHVFPGGIVADGAGNTATYDARSFTIDRTPPQVVATLVDARGTTVTPNAGAWVDRAVTVAWSCPDAGGSGVNNCPKDIRVGEGPISTYTRSATDRAGNTGTGTILFGVDTHGPTIAVALAGTLGAPGWYRSVVAATFTCTDAGPSGSAACPQPQTFSSEGAHTVTGSVTDGAGNTASLTPIPFTIDRTAPTLEYTTHALDGRAVQANAAGWFSGTVFVRAICTDAFDPAPACSGSATIDETAAAGATVALASSDRAGNARRLDAGPFRVDLTAPIVTAVASRGPDSNGWYNHAVRVTFAGTDALSGIDAASCTSPADYTGPDGRARAVAGSCPDVAGNVGTGMLRFDYDGTPPEIVFDGNAGSYSVDQTVAITCAVSDAMSGTTDDCAGVSGPAFTFGLGTTALTRTGRDLAGNERTASTSFTVAVSSTSLCTLARSMVNRQGIANSLCAKFDNIRSAPNDRARAGMLRALDNELAAQTGKALSQQDAGTLAALARGL